MINKFIFSLALICAGNVLAMEESADMSMQISVDQPKSYIEHIRLNLESKNYPQLAQILLDLTTKQENFEHTMDLESSIFAYLLNNSSIGQQDLIEEITGSGPSLFGMLKSNLKLYYNSARELMQVYDTFSSMSANPDVKEISSDLTRQCEDTFMNREFYTNLIRCCDFHLLKVFQQLEFCDADFIITNSANYSMDMAAKLAVWLSQSPLKVDLVDIITQFVFENIVKNEGNVNHEEILKYIDTLEISNTAIQTITTLKQNLIRLCKIKNFSNKCRRKFSTK